MEKQEFTISVFTENRTGLISRVVSVFTRRHINIDSLTTSQSSLEGIHRFTIVIQTTEEQVIRVLSALKKENLITTRGKRIGIVHVELLKKEISEHNFYLDS